MAGGGAALMMATAPPVTRTDPARDFMVEMSDELMLPDASIS